MKRLFSLGVSLLTILFFVMTGCSNDGGSSSSPDVVPGTLDSANPVLVSASEIAKTVDPNNEKVLLFYSRSDASYSGWGLWLWTGSGSGDAGYAATNGQAVKNGNIGYWDISTLCSSITAIQSEITSSGKLKVIIRNAAWTKDPGADQVLDLSTGKHFMVVSGDSTVYEVSDNLSPTIVSAVSTSSNAIKVSLSVKYGLNTSPSDSGFVLKDSNGTEYSISDSLNYDNQGDRNKNYTKTVLLKTSQSLDSSITYKISHSKFKPDAGVAVSIQGSIKQASAYTGNDLGLTLDGTKGTFKTWAPAASDVKLLVYSSVSDVGTFAAASVTAKSVGQLTDSELLGTPAQTIQMTKVENGVWSAEIADVSSYKYYKYQIVNEGKTYYVSDIWGKSCSADAVASQIVDINRSSDAIPSSTTDTAYGEKSTYYNPFNGENGSKAVIYEMHITDWSYAEDSSVGSVGKYLTIANGTKVINHLKDLGVTHVQLLPVFEFAETNANTKYNWGYNPYHYNVPEGRYVTAGYTDGTQAVLELRTLISKLHEAGISVIMDVVYNHTNGTGTGSLYDSTVPYYFYRFDSTGAYSNGSGCGNEFETDSEMGKKYVIDSLKHWMLDYHVNGFRFDLMGCLSKSTMKDIYENLHEIDSNVLVYGEPWTGGTAAVVNGASQAVSASSGTGSGAFDDDFRDAIKGAEFGGFKYGQVQGEYNDSGICTGLKGGTGNNKRNQTGKLSLANHYVECHDNYTLYDKLIISNWQKLKNEDKTKTCSGYGWYLTPTGSSFFTEEQFKTIKNEDTLSAAYVLLSQGTAFLNGGQEFLRTKQGNENSYNADIGINAIDLTFATTYSDVYNTYKGLIALRKANSDAFGANISASAVTVNSGVTKYTTGNFLVYFNATDAAVSITTTGYTTFVDITSGAVVESTTLPTSVPSKSFVILKK